MYSPNRISLQTRVFYIVLSTLVLGYGAIGLYYDDIYLPGRRSPGAHFHGLPAWLLFAAMVSWSVNWISAVVDHYDTRDNELNYRRIAKLTQILGWGLFFLALALDLVVFRKATPH